MENNQEFNFLGKRSTEPSKNLDVFPCPPNISVVTFESDELTSFCPVTHQPDFSKIVIEYSPCELCIESKSLKLYLWSFREEALFGESLASAIAEKVFEATMPHWCRVKIRQNIRGGLQLEVLAEKKA
ncbi:MAG: preQ(1) synthase [Bacteroidota bacterium]|nr:preQ(1) synthase [Bacteroidota bacterium]MDP4206723.1 preQ(1) synthase [Bacteroidota bacterium]